MEWLYIILAIIGVYLMYVAFRFLRITMKRDHLFDLIDKTCAKNKFQYRFLRKKHASVFFTKQTPDLVIDTPDAVYQVNLLSTRFKGDCYRITEKTNLQITRSRRTTFLSGKSKPGYRSINEIMSVVQEMDLPYGDGYPSGEGFKPAVNILLVLPWPRELYAASGSSLIQPGNGDLLFDCFYIYNQSGFIKLLEDAGEKT